MAVDGGFGEEERDIHLSINRPLPGFVGSINMLQRAMNALVQRGVASAGRPAEDAPPRS